MRIHSGFYQAKEGSITFSDFSVCYCLDMQFKDAPLARRLETTDADSWLIAMIGEDDFDQINSQIIGNAISAYSTFISPCCLELLENEEIIECYAEDFVPEQEPEESVEDKDYLTIDPDTLENDEIEEAIEQLEERFDSLKEENTRNLASLQIIDDAYRQLNLERGSRLAELLFVEESHTQKPKKVVIRRKSVAPK